MGEAGVAMTPGRAARAAVVEEAVRRLRQGEPAAAVAAAVGRSIGWVERVRLAARIAPPRREAAPTLEVVFRALGAYRRGAPLREVGDVLGVSVQRAAQVVDLAAAAGALDKRGAALKGVLNGEG